MSFPILALETAAELPIPLIGYFLIPFGILVACLAAVLLFGKGRPHS
ncbi:hypothetical protein ACQBAU_13090 [Propionibacteriaceae bacterium Y2011]